MRKDPKVVDVEELPNFDGVNKLHVCINLETHELLLVLNGTPMVVVPKQKAKAVTGLFVLSAIEQLMQRGFGAPDWGAKFPGYKSATLSRR